MQNPERRYAFRGYIGYLILRYGIHAKTGDTIFNETISQVLLAARLYPWRIQRKSCVTDTFAFFNVHEVSRNEKYRHKNPPPLRGGQGGTISSCETMRGGGNIKTALPSHR